MSHAVDLPTREVLYYGIERNKPKTRGIVLIAIGDAYYSHMAYNLAVSIKNHIPTMPICIFEREGSLDQIKRYDMSYFDMVLQMPDEAVMGRYGYNPFMAKLYLDKISPFDETLFLDVDMILSATKNLQGLFDELSARDLQFANRGEKAPGEKNLMSDWADLEEVRSVYGMEKIYDLSSEVIWFRKTDKVFTFFNKARKVYNDNKFNVRPFGGAKPDEIFFTVAMHLEGVRLNPCPFQPTYWQPYYFMKMHSREFMQGHYAISTGGSKIQANVKKVYDSLGRHYFGRMGVKKPFYELRPKSKYIKERKVI